jgi:hypothetical protein
MAFTKRRLAMKREKISWEQWCVKNVDTGDFYIGAGGWGNGLLTQEDFGLNSPYPFHTEDEAHGAVESLSKSHYQMTGEILNLKVVEFEVKEC